MFDEIVDAELKAVETYRRLMSQLTPKDHAWIARGMEKRVDEMKESAMKEIMDEVDVSFSSFHIFFHPSILDMTVLTWCIYRNNDLFGVYPTSVSSSSATLAHQFLHPPFVDLPRTLLPNSECGTLSR